MKKEELMINDLVLLNGEPKQVMEILYDSITIDCYPIEEDYIEPIPITPEILEKNGFTKGGMFGKTYYLAIGDFEVSVYFANANTQLVIEKRNGTTMINLLNVENVHKIQHALRLCGIEKEIKP